MYSHTVDDNNNNNKNGVTLIMSNRPPSLMTTLLPYRKFDYLKLIAALNEVDQKGGGVSEQMERW